MDWLTFFSTNIQSLAWPATAIIALFVLKHQITDLIRALGKRLLKAKGGGFEFTFGERIDQVEEILPAEQVKEIAHATTDAQRIEKISELSQLPHVTLSPRRGWNLSKRSAKRWIISLAA
jgi:hypothetical protein